MPSAPGSPSRTPAGHAAAGSPGCWRRWARMPGSSVSGTSGQLPEASKPATWPVSQTSPPTTRTVPMATSSRVSLAWWCSWAQAKHWHSGRSDRIATTPLRGVVDEQGAVAGLSAPGHLAKGPLPVAASDRGAPALAGRTAGGGCADPVEEVLSRLDRPAGRTASVAGRLDRQAGAARLVRHHEVPFFVAVEGFARVLAPVVCHRHRGRLLERAGCGRCRRLPTGWPPGGGLPGS
jgi:hypothetical protein